MDKGKCVLCGRVYSFDCISSVLVFSAFRLIQTKKAHVCAPPRKKLSFLCTSDVGAVERHVLEQLIPQMGR